MRSECVGQVVGGKAYQQFGTRRLLGRDAREQRFQQEVRDTPSFFRGFEESLPTAQQLNLILVLVGMAALEAAVASGEPFAIEAQAREKPAQYFRVGLMPAPFQPLVQHPQRERHPAEGLGIRRFFAQELEHVVFQVANLFQDLPGRVDYLVADEGGEQYALFDEPHFGHLVEDANDLLGGCNGLPGRFVSDRSGLGHACQFGQPVGIEGVIAFGVDHGLQDREPVTALGGREVERVELPGRLLQIPDQQLSLEYAGVVFVALQKLGALQPGNGRLDLGVGLTIFEIEAGFDLFIAEELAAGDDDLIRTVTGGAADSSQNLGNVLAAELRRGPEAELGLDVVLIVEQHTFGVF